MNNSMQFTEYEYSNLSYITNKITFSLIDQPYVRAITLFGSLADDSADKYSDIDMLVVCDNVDQTRWHAASIIRSVMPVMYYRKFSAVDQPSGRYWFKGESLFNRLDISFVAVNEYESIKKDRSRFGIDIVLKELYVNPNCRFFILPEIKVNLLNISIKETEIGLWVYRMLNGMKEYMRGEQPNRNPFEVIKEMESFVNEISRGTVMAGGDIGEMVYSVLDIFNTLKEKADRFL